MNTIRVILITQGISRITMPILNKVEVVGILESDSRKEVKKNLIYNSLKWLYQFLIPNRTNTLKKLCVKRKIPYLLYNTNIKEKAELWIKDKSPDLIIVFSMSQLLPKEIFDIPKYGTINLHPSLLPKYRGPNPWFWQYYFQETYGGVTIHFIDEGEDTGDIIYQQEYEIPLGIKSPDLYDLAIGQIGTNLLLHTLKNLPNIPRVPQNSKKLFRARNLKLSEHSNIIDFENFDGLRVWHILRGTEQWLKAIKQPRGIFKGQKWRIGRFIKTSIYDDKNKGSIIYIGFKNYLVVKSGIIELQIKFSFKGLIKKILNAE